MFADEKHADRRGELMSLGRKDQRESARKKKEHHTQIFSKAA